MSQLSFLTLCKRLKTIGRCAHNSVSKGIHIPTKNVVDLDTADIQREVVLLSQLCNASDITNYFGCYMDSPRVWIAMEQVRGQRQRAIPDEGITRKQLEGEIHGGHHPWGAYWVIIIRRDFKSARQRDVQSYDL